MNYAFFHESHESVDHLSEDIGGFFFGHGRVVPDGSFQITIAELLDDVVVIGAFHDFIDSHDVL